MKLEDGAGPRGSGHDLPYDFQPNASRSGLERTGCTPAAAATPDDETRADALRQLYQSHREAEHARAREILAQDPDYLRHLGLAYLRNPFLKLTEAESAILPPKVAPFGVGNLIAARDAATRSRASRYVVFSMPKSGSSFLASALQHALDLPPVSLTSVGGSGESSRFGMNSREQELDEMAVTKSALLHRSGFVAQHHTRYSQYLALQLNLYGLSPLVAVRNTLDCIVSFDDMMLARTEHPNRWVFDTQFPLPAGYAGLEDAARYSLLTHSLGVWLINFYLSWTRCRRQGLISPLIVRYEDHVLDTEALVAHVAGHLPMTGEQVSRLRAYADNPDRKRSRFNVGTKGRGAEKIPESLKQFLSDYARMFEGDLTDDDIRYLVR